jgi:hypothetical protein
MLTDVLFLLGDSSASKFYVLTFQNTISVPSFIGGVSRKKMEQAECSETLSHKIQMLGNHPKERIQLSECGKILKSRMLTDV